MLMGKHMPSDRTTVACGQLVCGLIHPWSCRGQCLCMLQFQKDKGTSMPETLLRGCWLTQRRDLFFHFPSPGFIQNKMK